MPSRLALRALPSVVIGFAFTVCATSLLAAGDVPQIDAINSRMSEFVAAAKASGVVTLVARDGEIVHLGAVGAADLEDQRSMTTDTLFAIASMTKPITSTALMMLVDEGKLSLDDEASKYIPELGESRLPSGPPHRPITVRDLITHTSGVAGSQQNMGTLAETAIAVAARPLAFEPGAKWQYSPGISLCGRIIEVVSGMPYETFLDVRLFEPLGMEDTTFFPNAEQQKRIARLYQPGEGDAGLTRAEHRLNELSPTRTANPSGGLFSTAEDLFRFYQFVLEAREGSARSGVRRLLSREAARQMTQIQTGDLETGFTPGNGWGLGWCVLREPQGVSEMLSPGTFGHGGAFGTQGWVDPHTRTIYVLLIQRTKFGNSDGAEIRAAFQQVAVDALK